MLCNDHEVLKDKTWSMKDVLGLAQDQSVTVLNSVLKTSDINKQKRLAHVFFLVQPVWLGCMSSFMFSCTSSWGRAFLLSTFSNLQWLLWVERVVCGQFISTLFAWLPTCCTLTRLIEKHMEPAKTLQTSEMRQMCMSLNFKIRVVDYLEKIF